MLWRYILLCKTLYRFPIMAERLEFYIFQKHLNLLYLHSDMIFILMVNQIVYMVQEVIIHMELKHLQSYLTVLTLLMMIMGNIYPAHYLQITHMNPAVHLMRVTCHRAHLTMIATQFLIHLCQLFQPLILDLLVFTIQLLRRCKILLNTCGQLQI